MICLITLGTTEYFLKDSLKHASDSLRLASSSREGNDSWLDFNQSAPLPNTLEASASTYVSKIQIKCFSVIFQLDVVHILRQTKEKLTISPFS